MFSSHYTHGLDGKGRLAFPPRWRRELGASVVVTRGLDPCLFVFPADKFQKLAEAVQALGLLKGDARALARFFFAQAISSPLDRQGRIVLNDALREFAGIGDEAIVVGACDRIEIWNPQRFAELEKKTEAEANQVAERMADALATARARGE